MPNLLITLDRDSYKTLQALADSDERAVDQQARYMRAGPLPPQP